MNDIRTIKETVNQMETQVRKRICERSEKQLWENTFIKKQIDRRDRGEKFYINDHIRAMVYAMLSSGASWRRVLDYTDLETGEIKEVDKIFQSFKPNKLLSADIENLKSGLYSLGLASQYTNQQMDVLQDNINILQKIEEEHGTIDNYYRQWFENSDTKINLINELSKPKKSYKLKQFGFALTCEYLRNVGYDLPKPDRHIRRILGKDYLVLSENQPASEREAFEIVIELANESGKSIAETDYILWTYCANGYGEICTMSKPRCECCKVEKRCAMNKKKGN